MFMVIAGGGKVGLNLARELLEKGHELSLIEQWRPRYIRLERELEAFPIKPARGLRVAQLFLQARELDAPGERRFHRDARFEVRLRLAPQRLARAQLAERKQQRGVRILRPDVGRHRGQGLARSLGMRGSGDGQDDGGGNELRQHARALCTPWSDLSSGRYHEAPGRFSPGR